MTTVVEQLTNIVGQSHVLTGTDVSARNPGYCLSSMDAGLLVRPQSTEEVSAIAACAQANNRALVAHGGMTGLVQGTASEQENIIISFERMNKVLRVDPVQNVLVAEAGVRLQDAHNAAAEHGLMLGVDIPSRGSCTVGGIISTNAGGVRVIRYGMTRENVLGLDVVLPDGSILNASNTLMKNNAGFDLKQLFIGSEGTLGLVTQAVFKLFPKPISESTALVGTDSVTSIIKLLAKARKDLGSSLLSFEVMWEDYYWDSTALPGARRPLEDRFPLYAIIESGQWLGGANDQLQSFLEEALAEGGIQDAVIASSLSERDDIWKSREESEAIIQCYDRCTSYDIGFEASDIEPFAHSLKRTMAQKWPDKKVYLFGHLGDGNLHVILGHTHEEYAQRKQYDDVLYGEVARYSNSTVSAEHGIGLEKRDYLHYSRSENQRDLMQKIMLALDPAGTLNPGKIV